MAFYHLRNKGQVYVYYWDGSKQRTLSRKFTRHLDGEAAQVIEEWVQRWANLNEVQKVRPDLSPLPIVWAQHVEMFCRYLLEIKNRETSTVADLRGSPKLGQS